MRGLLDFARQRKLQVENVDVNRILEETLSLVRLQPAFRHVQSKEGEGTTFWIKLPASSSARVEETVG